MLKLLFGVVLFIAEIVQDFGERMESGVAAVDDAIAKLLFGAALFSVTEETRWPKRLDGNHVRNAA
jgi:hypothetical protein